MNKPLLTAIALFSTLMLLLGCGGTSTEEPTPVSLQFMGKKISLELDETTPNFSMGLGYHEVDGKEWVYNINWEKNSLQAYDAASGKMTRNLVFEKEGPEGAGELFGFYVHNPDSIFLFSQRNPVIVLTDTSGKIKEKIQYDVPDRYSPAFVHGAYFLSPPVLIGEEMVARTRVSGNIREMNSEDLAGSHVSFAVNLNEGGSRFISHHYPADYMDKGAKQIEPSMAFDGEKFVYSFFGDHHLYYSEGLGQKLQSVSLPSAYLDRDLPVFPAPEKSQQYIFGSSRYEHLVYDPYREVYYRFAFPATEESDPEKIARLRDNPGDFVVMIIDKDLNLLGETHFPKGKYHPNNLFVGKDGLYLSIQHPDNPDNEEDRMVFECLELGG
ncbi:DUF4221 family protein [Litoribacter ruber]|uniref:DUF4221 family protein n=1 Tax=Litoribacter ruber TaxID=702568 RepID=UPI001BDB07EE|nr:DUF4221 family protein [Litoribacter ruber]MBT0811574.1 DUF4221 family protein [Litoribacter ruber]